MVSRLVATCRMTIGLRTYRLCSVRPRGMRATSSGGNSKGQTATWSSPLRRKICLLPSSARSAKTISTHLLESDGTSTRTHHAGVVGDGSSIEGDGCLPHVLDHVGGGIVCDGPGPCERSL